MQKSILHAYDVPRKRFGKQPQFSVVQDVMLDSIQPNPTEQRRYGLRNPVHHDCQVNLPQSQHDANTIRVELKNHGINHAEGGWPKEVHYNIEEETLRYRRRIEREDQYIHSIMALTPKFEKFIHQNNAIEIYEQYFVGMEITKAYEKPVIKVTNLYRDPYRRPVSSLSWTQEDDPKLVVSYCYKNYPAAGPINKTHACYAWALENPKDPASEFSPPVACWVLACSPINPAIISGGLEDGRVCIFDLRAENKVVALSPPHIAYRDPVTSLLYVHSSRQSNEFFTGSSDGQCMWHDSRNLSAPTDVLIMSVNIPRGETVSMSNAEGVSALQYDRALPTRFLCGTETGLVINVNRRGKTHNDIMSGVYEAHKGPVRAVHRSPCTTKMFLTCGDWTVHIWSEDIKTSPIITGMRHRYQIMDAVWAPERFSGYMTVSVDGKLRYWDLMRRNHKAVVSMPVSKYSLLKILPYDDGRFVAMGSTVGTVYLASLSRDLVSSEAKDKALMMQIYERECRREQILTTRLKEIRLKHKTDEATDTQEEELNEEAQLRAAEDEYRRTVIDEFRRIGVQPQPTVQNEAMRKR